MAIKAFCEAIGLAPKLAEAWYNKGLALQMIGRTSDADKAFAKAKELGFILPPHEIETECQYQEVDR